ncbi:uncharacterized protein BDZ83DRAFT_645553 [Colletotrichum acutatum]|uniref:Uncharacterized protein n=1 Tax=Glomerella acutata TaxID=27357 RepID=A0AAD8U8T6_GLOAC|nr:uncharacterized protein BDZ83DRAFT_645553 [Colletotrichum acutatum]KAK1701741.1 hypothetical protein BDZ83DRAFT_645553 [Colletotrichum acutatum]
MFSNGCILWIQVGIWFWFILCTTCVKKLTLYKYISIYNFLLIVYTSIYVSL